MELFIWGLHRDIAKRVLISHPTSLSQGIAIAEEIELAIKFLRRAPARNSGNTSQSGNSGTGSTSQGNPKGRWRRGGGHREGFSRRNSSGSRPQQSTPQLSTTEPNPQAQIRCHECGQIGHIRPNCPRLRLEAQGTGVHNQLETSRALVHNVELGRFQGLMGIKIPDLLQSM